MPPKLPLITKQEFIADLAAAIERGDGFAAGRISHSHVYRLSYALFAQRFPKAGLILGKSWDKLEFENLNQLGIFPQNLDFYRRFDEFYVDHLKNLDCIGIVPSLARPTANIVAGYELPGKLMAYQDLEPDRSIPADQALCYLPLLAGKKVLIVCPFAGFLKERATQEIFEGVWSKIGKAWFHPSGVDAVEFPYGFAHGTRERFPTVIDLFDDIAERISQRDFDVALIAAAGLSVPIASQVRNMGRIGLDIGGHLQIVFGVLGKRWRNKTKWQRNYYNDYWMDLPARYHPEETDVCDSGAYW